VLDCSGCTGAFVPGDTMYEKGRNDIATSTYA
jgi:hypothetical protein